MYRAKHLNDIFPEWSTGVGIFSKLQSLAVPWQGETISNELDFEYHGNISGDKIISPLVRKYISDETPTTEEYTAIAETIFALYALKWGKLWETMYFEYDPIENYSMREDMKDDETVTEYGKTRTRTDNLTHSKTGTETDTPNLTDTQTSNLTKTTESKISGFNSVTSSPADDITESSTGTATLQRTGTNTRTYNTGDSNTGTQTDADTGSDTQTRNYTLTRRGNIGVTTSQQMIESERALWMWDFFHTVVFPDVDRVLTLQIY